MAKDNNCAHKNKFSIMMTSKQAKPEPSHLKLMIVDDHPMYSDGLKLTLQQLAPELELLSAENLSAAKATISEHQDLDLILLDLTLPDGKGLSLIHYLRANQIFIPCVIISASDETLNVRASIQAGASGFISKANSGTSILASINKVLAGDICLPDTYKQQSNLDQEGAVAEESLSLPQLTPRQKDVLKLLAQGHPNKVICQHLNLTEHTVKSHLKAIFQALHVHSRTECVHVANLLGILD